MMYSCMELNMNVEVKETILKDIQKKKISVPDFFVMSVSRAIESNYMGKGANLELHRKYNKIMDNLESHKAGVVYLDEKDIDFILDNLNKANLPVQRDISHFYIQMNNALLEAKKNAKSNTIK